MRLVNGFGGKARPFPLIGKFTPEIKGNIMGKRSFSLFLLPAFIVCLAFSGCGGGKEAVQPANPEESIEQNSQEDSSSKTEEEEIQEQAQRYRGRSLP